MSEPASDSPIRRRVRDFTQWLIEGHRDNYHEEAQQESDSDESRRRFQEELEEVSLSSSSISPTRLAELEQEANVEAYKKMKENFGLSLNKALRQAQRIQRRYPKKLLCGSLALYLYGVIKRDTFGDIDFVAYEKNVIPKEYISLKCSKPNKHCLFLSADVREGKTIRGLKLQDIDQLIYWKTQFGRDSDKEDLQAYLDSQFIKEDEFLINL